jgi:hypothetical protein
MLSPDQRYVLRNLVEQDGSRRSAALSAHDHGHAVAHAAFARDVCDGFRMVHKRHGIQRRTEHHHPTAELDEMGVGRARAVGVVVGMPAGNRLGEGATAATPASGCPLWRTLGQVLSASGTLP